MLPDQFQIDIPSAKINDYLLNSHHRDGWSKAKFFRKHRFATEEDVKILLASIIYQNDVKQIIQTKYGTKYIVEGALLQLVAISR